MSLYQDVNNVPYEINRTISTPAGGNPVSNSGGKGGSLPILPNLADDTGVSTPPPGDLNSGGKGGALQTLPSLSEENALSGNSAVTSPPLTGVNSSQRLFESFNPNSTNPYGGVTTGTTDYGYVAPGDVGSGGATSGADAASRDAVEKINLNRSAPGQAAADASLDASRSFAANGGATRGGNLGDGTRGGSSGGYISVSDRFDGGGAGVKGGAYSGGGAVSTAANAVSGGDGPGGDGGTVICTSMHTLGLISDEIYRLDAKFGEAINHTDPSLLAGYRLWATPVADYILGNSWGSRLLLSIVTPFATAWASQMAHTMCPEEYNPSKLGKVVMFLGHPVCRLAGYISRRKTSATPMTSGGEK